MCARGNSKHQAVEMPAESIVVTRTPTPTYWAIRRTHTLPTPNMLSLMYYGGDADRHRLNLYDASISYEGLARTLAVIGHFYLKQEIIVKAPSSVMPLYLVPPEEGSLKQNIIAGIVGGLVVMGVSVPYTIFATRLIESWVPAPPNPENQEMIRLLKEQNDLLRKQMNLPVNPNKEEKAQCDAADHFIKEKSKELQVVRSVTSQSFKKIFRPIETGAVHEIAVLGGVGGGRPKAVVDKDVLKLIEADAVDRKQVTLMGVVSSFSRSSKTGIVFSRDYMAGFRIQYDFTGRLPREDDFSWSQFSGKPISMTGRFVRFFDGKVKKFLVSHVERVVRQDDIDDYFNNDRPVLTI